MKKLRLSCECGKDGGEGEGAPDGLMKDKGGQGKRHDGVDEGLWDEAVHPLMYDV